MSVDFEPILGLSCIDYVTVALRTSEPITDIVEEILRGGELEDSTREEIAQMVEAYAVDIGLGTSTRLAKGMEAIQALTAAKNVNDDIQVLDQLIEMQLRRLSRQEIKEVEQGFPFKTFGLELDVATKAVKTRAQVRVLMSGGRPYHAGADIGDDGHTDSETEKLANLERLYGKRVAEVLKNPTARRKMLGTLESIQAMSPALQPLLVSGEDDSDA